MCVVQNCPIGIRIR
ncbi:MAG: hypothetical protein EB168_02330 [Euryarchaeota archaeon]|nr:hypothetical protein [Euryarchaeota archaeon]